MKDGLGSIRTDIQGPGGGEVAAAGERSAGGSGARGWSGSGDSGALARGCAVQARPRAGLDCGRPARSGDHHGGDERGGQERLVSRARGVPGRVGQVARELHHRIGRSRGRARQSPGHACRPPAHQGTRARPAAQGPGAGRDGSAAGAVKKVSAIFNTGEDE